MRLNILKCTGSSPRQSCIAPHSGAKAGKKTTSYNRVALSVMVCVSILPDSVASLHSSEFLLSVQAFAIFHAGKARGRRCKTLFPHLPLPQGLRWPTLVPSSPVPNWYLSPWLLVYCNGSSFSSLPPCYNCLMIPAAIEQSSWELFKNTAILSLILGCSGMGFRKPYFKNKCS